MVIGGGENLNKTKAIKRTKDAFGSVACSSYLGWMPFLCQYIGKQLDKIQRLMNDDHIVLLTCNRKYFGVAVPPTKRV